LRTPQVIREVNLRGGGPPRDSEGENEKNIFFIFLEIFIFFIFFIFLTWREVTGTLAGAWLGWSFFILSNQKSKLAKSAPNAW